MPVASSILLEPGRVDAVNLVEVVVEPPGIERGLTQHIRQVDVVDRQNFADHIEDAVIEDGPHLFELFEKPLQDAALDDGLPLLGSAGRRN